MRRWAWSQGMANRSLGDKGRGGGGWFGQGPAPCGIASMLRTRVWGASDQETTAEYLFLCFFDGVAGGSCKNSSMPRPVNATLYWRLGGVRRIRAGCSGRILVAFFVFWRKRACRLSKHVTQAPRFMGPLEEGQWQARQIQLRHMEMAQAQAQVLPKTGSGQRGAGQPKGRPPVAVPAHPRPGPGCHVAQKRVLFFVLRGGGPCQLTGPGDERGQRAAHSHACSGVTVAAPFVRMGARWVFYARERGPGTT